MTDTLFHPILIQGLHRSSALFALAVLVRLDIPFHSVPMNVESYFQRRLTFISILQTRYPTTANISWHPPSFSNWTSRLLYTLLVRINNLFLFELHFLSFHLSLSPPVYLLLPCDGLYLCTISLCHQTHLIKYSRIIPPYQQKHDVQVRSTAVTPWPSYE